MKYIIVTGAYGGMGRAAAKELATRGYRVFALDKKVMPAEEGIVPIEADVTLEESLKSAAEKISEYTKDIFAIIHFAGVYMLDSLVETEGESFEKIMKINFFGALYVNKVFTPFLRRGSRIIITASELAPLDPLPFTGIYAVSKSSLDKYAYSLRMELQLLGIHVSVIRAGAVNTGMLGTSTKALDIFCDKTALYHCNAARFRRIVERVETKCVEPAAIARKVLAVLGKKKPSFAYGINRNIYLRLLNILPKTLQFAIIRLILK